ncbi:MAG: hypothetical protein WD887_02630 [Candidatus Saccharimonadales bacterium]
MRIFNSLQRKIASALVIGMAVVLIPASTVLAGWGPSRSTFTWDNTATYITFNSITDNPTVGDERPFLSGKVTTASGNVVDNINVQHNDEVVLRVYFHNNAAANLNLVATNTRVKIFLPTVSATNTFATSFITSDNSNPGAVTDTVDFTGARPFTLSYVNGSARLTTNALNGVQLSDNIVNNTGAQVGYDQINGNVPGCGQFSGFVTIRVRVNMPAAPTPPTTPTVTPTAKPVATTPVAATTLPNTGPGAALGLFAGASAVGSAAHFAVRRLRSRA